MDEFHPNFTPANFPLLGAPARRQGPSAHATTESSARRLRRCQDMSDSEQELDGGTLGEAPAADPLMLTNLPKAVEPELHELQRICIRLMRLEDEAHFPGSQPVSFERRHLAPADDVAAAGRRAVSLMRQEFYAAEKTDGVRYMLLILARGAFMVDRNFEMRRLPPMHFPSRKPGEPPLDSTLLDGELVEDERQDSGPRRLRYLVHDACCVCGAALTTEPLTARLMAARREVLAARFAAAGGGHDFSSECFAMELKDFFHIRQLPHLLQHVTAHTRTAKGESARRGEAKRRFSFDDPLRRLRHGSDGLIFTPVRDPYSSGTCAASPTKASPTWHRPQVTQSHTQAGLTWPEAGCVLQLHGVALLVYCTYSGAQVLRWTMPSHAGAPLCSSGSRPAATRSTSGCSPSGGSSRASRGRSFASSSSCKTASSSSVTTGSLCRATRWVASLRGWRTTAVRTREWSSAPSIRCTTRCAGFVVGVGVGVGLGLRA